MWYVYVIYPKEKIKGDYSLKNTVNKFILRISFVFKVTEEYFIDTFENETNNFINPMEQLIKEDEHLIKDLENEY